MTEKAHAYLPIDRRLALTSGQELPTDVWGSALEADLSGFTALTEALARDFGEQRGAEELTRRLNWMYEGLINEVHRFGGTILGFSGDAFTCWLEGDDGARAAACAQSLQRWLHENGDAINEQRGSIQGTGQAARNLGPTRMKVAVATGATRRFLVGDPSVQRLEGLAGTLVDELAAVEHGAEPGDIVLAASARASLGTRAATGDRGVLLDLVGVVSDLPWPEPQEDPDNLELVRPWLLPAVFARLAAGAGDFLAELRPATALFARFLGIRFEDDRDALDRLDAFVRSVQSVLSRYEGTLVQLTVGDKGSYLYAAFGAPVAHEDDAARAVLAALDLRHLGGRGGLVDPISIGIASGRLRAGAYGGSQRRTYGVLGDTVNLAARLMQAAPPGQAIVTQAVRTATSGFSWTSLPDLTVKGKAQPVQVARLRGLRARASRVPSRDDNAGTEMLGRREELSRLESYRDLAAQGQGQLIGVTAEAGMGKTRLVLEMVSSARRRGIVVHQGECPSYGVNSSYAVWRPIWTRLFGLPERASVRRRIDAAADQLIRAAPSLEARLPLLGPLLGLQIPDNDLTRSFDGKVRKTSLEATLAQWLRVAVRQPTVIVLEDCHWIDALSEDLLVVVGRVIRELPVLAVTTYRPRDVTEGGELGVVRQSHFRQVALSRLSDDDVNQLIRRRLQETTLPPVITAEINRLAQRAEGNPFYLHELLDYIIDLGPDALDPSRLAELPSSLQRLILSRIDRLEERPRSTLKIASAVGRVFDSEVLSPVLPELGTDVDVQLHLITLANSRFVVTESPPGTVYSFNHAITQEVAYSTIAGKTRAALHGRIGRLLEQRAGGDTDRQLDLLAHHFSHSDDDDRRRQYVLRAAGAAQARYANRTAIDYYRNILPLFDGAPRGDVLLQLGRTLALAGSWDEADDAFRSAADEAAERGDLEAQAWAETERGELLRKQGRYDEALATFDAALAKFHALSDDAGVAEVFHYQGTLAAQRGETPLARTRYRDSLESRRRLGDRRGMARSLNGLGIVAEYEGDFAAAATLYREALDILSDLGDTWGVAALTNNAGMAVLLQGHFGESRPLFERAVALQREIGDPDMLANFLSNLGDAARELGDPVAAMACYEESLVLCRELGEKWLIAYLLEDVAMLAAQQSRPTLALRLASAGAQLRQQIGAPLPPASRKMLDERLEVARLALSPRQRAKAEESGAQLTWEQAVEEAISAKGANTSL